MKFDSIHLQFDNKYIMTTPNNVETSDAYYAMIYEESPKTPSYQIRRTDKPERGEDPNEVRGTSNIDQINKAVQAIREAGGEVIFADDDRTRQLLLGDETALEDLDEQQLQQINLVRGFTREEIDSLPCLQAA